MAKSPNFFILGAPKCGTTSMAMWLSRHPNVFMSPWKEPKYFDRDLKTRLRLSRRQYLNLFKDATDEHLAVGEATVWYLYSQAAIPAIERELPGARFLVMLRNPVDMAYALHEQMVMGSVEREQDFARAWHMSAERRQGHGAWLWVTEPRRLDYQGVCSLGEQVGRLFTLVPRTRVLLLVLEDVREDPHREYLRVLRFLGLPDDGRSDFPVHNPAKRVRSPVVQAMLKAAKKGDFVFQSNLGLSAGHPTLWRMLYTLNRSPRPRPPLTSDLRSELQEFFAKDIAQLEGLMGRDLSHWKGNPA
jgi:hypothetical protein